MPIFMNYEGVKGSVTAAGQSKVIETASLAETPTRSAAIDMPDVLVTSWQSSTTAGEIHVESFSWGTSNMGSHAAPGGGTILIRNHELSTSVAADDLVVTPADSNAGFDAFLRLDGVDGESEVVEIHGADFSDLLPADDGGAAAAIGSANWGNYRVSVDSIE